MSASMSEQTDKYRRNAEEAHQQVAKCIGVVHKESWLKIERAWLQLAERAREKRPDMPIVLMSGKVVGRPGFPVIRKPFSQPQLAEIVGPIIGP